MAAAAPRTPQNSVLLARGVDVVGDEEVEVSVAIDVDERAARAPQRRAGPAGVGHLGEPAAAGIAIEGVRADVGDVQVDQAVVVDVAGARPHPVAAVSDVRGGRHVLERAVAPVSIQPVARAPGHRGIGERAAVDEKHIEPAVVVEIEEEAP